MMLADSNGVSVQIKLDGGEMLTHLPQSFLIVGSGFYRHPIQALIEGKKFTLELSEEAIVHLSSDLSQHT